ncbi:Protein dispatched -like protein 3 [Triplophysa tibetana]|uniref:Protein dispatched-like protein 3 n=1 Tax=Triplophysa tibetana TaxID=1572043 RepID=A0A5A9NV78_9TELE|nr:Protein dispatched -like protein 3 [Triplophysa tibetana]
MDSEDEPLLLQGTWNVNEFEEEEDGEVGQASGEEQVCRGVWWALGWVYTQPWASGLVLVVGFLVPFALSTYMFLKCEPLDIDLSYSAFEVRSHSSAERFDALTIALKNQLGSWDRHRRDADGFDLEANALRDLLLLMVNRQEGKDVSKIANVTSPAGILDTEPTDTGLGHENDNEKSSKKKMQETNSTSPQIAASVNSRAEDHRKPHSALIRKRRFASYSYFQTQALWRIELVFVAQGDEDNNIFTPERLYTIHKVERLLMQHAQFQQFCWKPLEALRDLPLGPSFCSPPSSLLSYLFPSERAGKIYYDGMGPDLADVHGALSLAISHPQFYWYVDEKLTPDRLQSSLLRSEIHFGAPLPSFYSLQDRPLEQRRQFRDFVVRYADILSQQSTSKVKVLYGGTELFDDEVRKTFHSDMLLALFSGGCIAVLVYVLTSFSVFLTFFGLASIGLSCLVALFLYHVVFGVQYLGILNGVAAFVIIGIGVDDVFVFISTFRQAAHLTCSIQRMIYTVKTAGRATFLTSFTTAAAYAANTFSQTRTAVPPMTYGRDQWRPGHLEHWNFSIGLDRQTYYKRECTQREGISESDKWNTVTKLSASPSPLSDDDDVALLTVEMDPGVYDSDSDVALLSLSVEAPLTLSTDGSVGDHQCPPSEDTKTLGVYVLILLGSVWCCCLLRPASHSPVLFHRDTNLQRLLDLRSNLSAQGISCHMCSGVFMERPHNLHSTAVSTSSTSGKHATIPDQTKPVSTNAAQTLTGGLFSVYVFKLDLGSPVPVYRYSLTGNVSAPWQASSSGHGDVPFFQAYRSPHSNFSTRITVCVSHAYHPRPRWMLTLRSCDGTRRWMSEFEFYVALDEQQNSRKLYFAQHTISPYPSRVCAEPPGCVFSSGPDGPTQGRFYAPLPPVTTQVKVSRTSGFNPCSGGGCGKPAVRPLVDTGAMVFVVFGILGVNRTQHSDNHVIGDLGNVIYDPDFDLFNEIGHLCQLCKAISANTKLVKPGGAQCLPSGNSLTSILPLLHPDCLSLPEPNLLPGQLSHGAVGMQGGRVHWISMAFESTTFKGKSSFQTHSDFLQWESFLQKQLASIPASSALRRGFQTCQHWKQIFMEIIGKRAKIASVESALYSLLLSLAICIASVAVFTAHPLLLLPILLSILGMVCLVVAVMYWLGWEMGAVEAISLSILVGSSVDYCLHLAEGYLLAGDIVTSGLTDHGSDSSIKRQLRTLEAANHVGVAIVSSAVTTVISTIPLFFCVIVPFAKFGQIVAINTAISIAYTLSVTTALLATMGPTDFTRPPGAVLKAAGVVLILAVCGGLLWWTGSQFAPGGLM